MNLFFIAFYTYILGNCIKKSSKLNMQSYNFFGICFNVCYILKVLTSFCFFSLGNDRDNRCVCHHESHGMGNITKVSWKNLSNELHQSMSVLFCGSFLCFCNASFDSCFFLSKINLPTVKNVYKKKKLAITF